MYEKILQRLKDQRGENSNVSDRTLEDMARSYEKLITTDEQLEVADFTGAIKSINGNIIHNAAEAAKAAQKKKEEDDKSKGKTPEEIAEEERKKAEAEKGGSANIADDPVVKALMEQNKAILESLNGLKSEKTTSTRRGSVEAVLKDLPDFYKTPILHTFDGVTFKDDEAFNTFLESTKTGAATFKQAAEEQGLNTNTPPSDTKHEEKTGETETLADARKVANKVKEDAKTE